MSAILTFGELLMRIAPDMEGKWTREQSVSCYIGGAEANVAQALASWQVPVTYVTSLPSNFVSEQITRKLYKNGIDTSHIHYHGDRIGLYYLTEGEDLKSAEVVYDRQYSSFSKLTPGMIAWEKIFEDVTWFHISAISPALNQNVAEVCLEAVRMASERNIFISIDLNYRSKLWQYGKSPSSVLPAIAEYCDLIMGNIWSAHTLLEIPFGENNFLKHSKEGYCSAAAYSSQELLMKYKRCKYVAYTFRISNENNMEYFGTLHKTEGTYTSKVYAMDKVVSRVGSGDCFMAGLMYGFYHKMGDQELLECAAASAFSKFFVKGDATHLTRPETEELVKKYEQ